MYRLLGKGLPLWMRGLILAPVLLAVVMLMQYTQLSKLRAQSAGLEEQLVDIEKINAEINRYPAVSKQSSGLLTDQELRQIFNRRGLRPDAMKESAPGVIRVEFNKVDFNKLMSSIPMFQRALIVIEQLDLSKLEQEGFVQGAVVFTRL
ncbi:hypothetical protein [Neptuniibacter sp. QD34_54]|uniref:hypothetical protein n=1 Tax=Neptuniibacter sp. QD34_54 TaxID=3398208 RepID=UPI0039F5579F